MTIQNLKDVRVHFDNPLANLKRERNGRFTATFDLEAASLDNFTMAPELNTAFGLQPGDRRFMAIDTQGRDYQVQFMRASSVGKTTTLCYDLAGALALEFETEQREDIKHLRAWQEENMAELRRLLRGHFGKLAPPPSEVYNWDLPYALRGVEDEPYNRQLHTYAGRFYGMPRLRTIAAYVQVALEDWTK